MDKILYALFFVFLILTGSVMMVATADLDMSSWDFAGAEMAKGFVQHIGLIFFVVCAGAIIFVGMKKR